VDILDDMRVSKLSAKVFFKVNYSFICNYLKPNQNVIILTQKRHFYIRYYIVQFSKKY